MVLNSCGSSDDPGCFVSDINFTNLESAFDCENTENLLEIDLQDTFTLINTQADFEGQTSGPCAPEIDFENFTLIIGKQSLANGNSSISYDYTNDCATNSNTLNVTFNQNATTEAPNITYHILSPKIEEGTTLEVIIEINNS